jgi:hypothetical protein
VFRAYVEQMSAPALRPGDVVALDNLPAHKWHGLSRKVRTAALFEISLVSAFPADSGTHVQARLRPALENSRLALARWHFDCVVR